MANKKRFYVVWTGRTPGIYDSWPSCQEQTKSFEGARYKAFDTLIEAQKAFSMGYGSYYATHRKQESRQLHQRPQGTYLAVDAACSGNPGKMEYRGVLMPEGKQIFHKGPFEDGTNNIGEFLAIVHALALLKQKNVHLPIYSDSANALLWVKKKKCGTKLAPSGRNEELFDLIDRAETWLATHDYSDLALHKWETASWGEVPADFGRK